MGNKLQINGSLPSVRKHGDRGISLLASLVRKPLFAYTTIAIVLSIGVGIYDHTQRAAIVANEHTAHSELAAHQYKECLDIESVKAQANTRIVLLKKAQTGIVFKTPRIEAQVSATLNAVKPLSKVDCTPLRPGK